MTTALFHPDVDTLPWERLRAQQLTDFAPLLARLRTAEAWREKLAGVPDAVASEEALHELPYTTKADLRGAQTETSDELPLGSLQVASSEELRQITSSSGTTGVPVFFGLTAHDLERWRQCIGNAYRTAGVRPGTRVAHTTGMAIVAGGLPYADGIREAGGALAWIGGQTVPRMAVGMERTRANVLVSTASFSAHFAKRCAEELGRPATDLHVHTVIAGGEPGVGVPHIRQGILDAWGASRVSEFMGLGDVLPALWAECEEGNGMHFTASPDVFVELIDPASGEHIPWEPGATGEAVYTTLSREASPVLRFRSRDQMQVQTVECACGRTSPTVRCVGRTDDMLIFKAMNVYPSAIREVVLGTASDHLTGTMRIRKETAEQVRFDDPIPLEVELRPDAARDAARQALDQAAEEVRQQLRVRVSIEPKAPGIIPVSDYKNALAYVAD